MKMINDDFIKWAKGYSGFDGGNPNAGIWLCGIEWGGHQTEDIEALKKDFLTDVSEIPYGYDDHYKNLEYPYNYKFLKIMATVKGIDFLVNGDNSKNIKKILTNFNNSEKCFTYNSNYLKLNIFPLQFKEDRDNLWTEVYQEATGLETKDEYRKWCLEKGRLELFQKMINKSHPKLIITSGTSYFNYYKEAFGFKNHKFHTIYLKSDDRKKIQYIYHYDDYQVMLVNIPFLGRPLNSHKLMIEVGHELGSLISQHNIEL